MVSLKTKQKRRTIKSKQKTTKFFHIAFCITYSFRLLFAEKNVVNNNLTLLCLGKVKYFERTWEFIPPPQKKIRHTRT